jgi:hypothetical protein
MGIVVSALLLASAVAGLYVVVTHPDLPTTLVYTCVAFVLFALATSYVTTTYHFNETALVIDDQSVRLSYEPLFWPGGTRVDRTNIADIRRERRVVGANSSRSSTSIHHDVVLERRRGGDVTLMSFKDPQATRFVEQLVNEELELLHSQS